MILAIDIGNTTAALGALERDGKDFRVSHSGRMRTNAALTAEECFAQLTAALDWPGRPAHWEGAVMSSVVPAMNAVMRQSVERLCGMAPVEIDKNSDMGLRFGAHVDPDSIGHDRLVDAAWAAANLPLPAVTVDMGTATTFNVIGAGGVFLGGMIAPGLATGLNALSARAAQLPRLRLRAPRRLVGGNTEECMLAGAVYGAAAMIDGLTARVEGELGQPVSLVITGGLARHVHAQCRHPNRYDPALLLKGLGLLYDRCRPRR